MPGMVGPADSAAPPSDRPPAGAFSASVTASTRHEQRSRPTMSPAASEIGRWLTIKEALDLARIPETASM